MNLFSPTYVWFKFKPDSIPEDVEEKLELLNIKLLGIKSNNHVTFFTQMSLMHLKRYIENLEVFTIPWSTNNIVISTTVLSNFKYLTFVNIKEILKYISDIEASMSPNDLLLDFLVDL